MLAPADAIEAAATLRTSPYSGNIGMSTRQSGRPLAAGYL